MRAAMGLASIVLCSGCVTDFEDGGDENANGCSRIQAQNIAQVTLPGSAPNTCRTVAPGTSVTFQTSGGSFTCTLCDGRSNGDTIESRQSGPIGCKPLKPSIQVPFMTVGTYPFYCQEDVAIGGAIFVAQ